MKDVINGTVIAFFLKVVGAGLSFAFSVVLARLLGTDGTGLYFLALSTITIVSVVARLGLDNALLRYIATHMTLNEWDKAKGVYSLGIRFAICSSLLLTLIVFVSAPWIAITVFNDEKLTELIRWMSFAILPFALLNLHAESLKGLKQIKYALLVQGVGVPAINLALIYPLVLHSGVLGAVWSYVLASTIVLISALYFWSKSSRHIKSEKANYSKKELWDTCKPLFANSILKRALIPWMPLFILGIFSNSSDVGIFGISNRITMMISFALATITSVLSPKFAELYANSDMDNLRKVVKNSTIMISAFSLPFFILIILLSELIMKIFGGGFAEQTMPLIILSISQFFNVLIGPVGILLTMTGHEKYTLYALVYSTIILFILCLTLIPLYGVVGCALAAGIADLIRNLLIRKFCKDKLNITLLF
jgi:O-antigen/teichoic acid export membrane protein